jgi:hypothetical protein
MIVSTELLSSETQDAAACAAIRARVDQTDAALTDLELLLVRLRNA